MEYAARGQAASALSQFQGGGAAGSPVAQRTLAARLEAAANIIGQQCGRIQEALARVNGTPRGGEISGANKTATPATAPLAMTVEAVEMHAKRLCDLASNLDQVA